MEQKTKSSSSSSHLLVKVYKEGSPIGRKLDLFTFSGYEDLASMLSNYFNTTIKYGDGNSPVCRNHHILTYLDNDGDWMLAGDIPRRNFLSTVRRLYIRKPMTPS